jgi:hypothetical protein
MTLNTIFNKSYICIMMTLHMMRTPIFILLNQHTVVGYWTQARLSPTNNDAESHMATSMIPSGSLAKLSPCIPGIDPLPFVLHEPTSLAL